jgi:hypothetical protein
MDWNFFVFNDNGLLAVVTLDEIPLGDEKRMRLYRIVSTWTFVCF